MKAIHSVAGLLALIAGAVAPQPLAPWRARRTAATDAALAAATRN